MFVVKFLFVIYIGVLIDSGVFGWTCLTCCDVQCEKIRKQKGKFLGSFRVAHTTSLDETDNKIMSVRCQCLVSSSVCCTVFLSVFLSF